MVLSSHKLEHELDEDGVVQRPGTSYVRWNGYLVDRQF
jgi:hypothetical protein